MKRLLNQIFLLVLVGASAYFIYQTSFRLPCDKPLRYSIGRFDTKFGLSEADFKSYVSQAGTVWEDILKRKAFIYDPNADFKINLIYDERQLATIQKQKTEFGLSAVEEIFKKLDAEFSLFKSAYERRTNDYEKSLAIFKARRTAFEAEVAEWNQRGGAPKNKFEELEAERKYLNTEAARLNAEVSTINDMSKKLNTLLTERNSKAAAYNKMTEDYNKKYNQGLEFNQAEYNGKEINVYQFSTKKDLVLALTHEFGHALDMDHVENPKSIMYYLTSANTESALVPSAEDLAELKRACPDAR